MMSYTKILFSIFIVLILVASASPIFAAEDKPERRALEIVYPILQGGETLTSKDGLPQYIDYVFKFALAIIGFIILAVMVNNGLGYVMSAGNAEKLLAAKQGIMASFVGALVLFGAVILFNTINPEILKLTDEDLDPINPVIQPGIYLCNYPLPKINSLISTYKTFETDKKSLEARVEAVREIKSLMKNEFGTCYKVNYSANIDLDDLAIKSDGYNTIFAIPTRIYDNKETEKINENDWEYNYGIVFHERSNWAGECVLNLSSASYLIPFMSPAGSISSATFPNFNFSEIKSVTLFEKPESPVSSSSIGAGLFQCVDYGDICPSRLDGGVGAYAPFNTDGKNYKKVSREELGDLAGLDRAYLEPLQGTRSVKIDKNYFVIMFEGENYDGKKCEVISKSENNLFDQPIGRCGNDCNTNYRIANADMKYCRPCLKSMIVVSGNVIY